MWFTWSHWILFIRKKVVQTYMFQNTWFDCSSQWASISREKISLRISGFLPSFSCCSGSSLTTSPFLTFASRSSIDFSSFFKFLNFFWGSTEVGGALPVFGWLKKRDIYIIIIIIYIIFTFIKGFTLFSLQTLLSPGEQWLLAQSSFSSFWILLLRRQAQLEESLRRRGLEWKRRQGQR